MCTDFNPIYFSNENDDCMEYRLGDKVKVRTFNGVICHISPALEKYHVRTENNGVILVDESELEKLPNYAVGDVVRLVNPHNKKEEIVSISSVEGLLYAFHEKGKGLFSEQYVIPFDGFRIGDTVWTAKRGKGTIVLGGTHDPERPHCVNYDDGKYPKCVYPKLSNLFPTERKMLESLPKKISYFDTPVLGSFGILATRHFVIENTPLYGQATSDPIRPKFKAGDVVFYNSPSGIKKWTVDIVWHPKSGTKYGLKGFKCCELHNICVAESDLRLWKESKLTHCLQSGSDNWYKSDKYTPINIKFIGNINGHDTFTGESCGVIHLYRGTKGDDIQ